MLMTVTLSATPQVGDGDRISVGGLEASVLDTPGHTRGHITYFFPSAPALFPGGEVGWRLW